MSSPFVRPSPEELLRRVQAEEEYERRGRLKIFLGYASGVGKSFRMLDEGRRRRERGQDVVVGAIQPKSTPELDEVLRKLDVIPLKSAGGVSYMDTEAILQRHPLVCLVDGLAYDNPPGSPHPHRWQDVEQLLQAGISVITSINLQYVEERRDEVARIQGKRASVTVPESFLRTADEIEMVDAPAEYCIEQAATGTPVALAELEQRLSQLREIALLLAADVVDQQLERYLDRNGVGQAFSTQERILVCMTPKANGRRMMQRACAARDRFHGELFVVHVGQAELSADDQSSLERNLAIAREAGARVRLLEGDHDPVKAILQFAHEHRVTQIYVGHSPAQGWWTRLKKTAVDRLIESAEGMDVKLFPH
jgi:two-component system, OmpR family, sensor histidine kinase KdpD